MKNIFKIGTLALCLVVGLSSCNDFFDAIPGEQYDLEDTFTNRSKTEQFLNNVYNYVPDETLERSARNTSRGSGQPVRWNASFHGTEIMVANGLPEPPMQVPHG